MHIVYVLRDTLSNRLYKGVTNNLARRLREHLSGRTKTTAGMSNLVLAHKEEYDTFGEARKRELYLKSAAGRRFLKKKLHLPG